MQTSQLLLRVLDGILQVVISVVWSNGWVELVMEGSVSGAITISKWVGFRLANQMGVVC